MRPALRCIFAELSQKSCSNACKLRSLFNRISSGHTDPRYSPLEPMPHWKCVPWYFQCVALNNFNIGGFVTVPVCQPPGTPTGGSFTTSDDSYPVGTVVTFVCSTGYVLRGNSRIECTSGPVWSGNPPLCSGNLFMNAMLEL